MHRITFETILFPSIPASGEELRPDWFQIRKKHDKYQKLGNFM